MFIILLTSVIMLTVFIHEMGHLLAARYFGVRVHDFSIGFGPIVCRWQGKHNPWTLRAIPLGGYVSLDTEFTKKATPWAKGVIALAGPLVNLLPFVILGSFTLGFVHTLEVFTGAYDDTAMGVLRTIFSPLDIFHWIPNDPTSQVSGVVGIGSTTKNMLVDNGFAKTWVTMFIVLNIGLGMFNLLPIPPLDGGPILIACVEGVFTKTLAEKVGAWLAGIGVVIVAWLLVVTTVKDISHLF
jgi:regulator of sigma E protease